MSKNQPIIDELRKRTEGLMFLSEVDHPFTIFCCNPTEPLPAYLKKLAGRAPGIAVDETSLSYLFKNITGLHHPEDGDEKQNSEQYKSLLDYLTNSLNDIKVYRIGEGDVDIFIVGSTPDGDYVSLSTKAKES